MTGMSEIEVSPQEQMTNPKYMKVFAFERRIGFLKTSCFFMLCVECNRRHSYLRRIVRLSGVCYGALPIFNEWFPNEDATSASRSLQENSTKSPWG